MVNAATLIVVTMLSAGAPSPQVTASPMPNHQHCARVMRRSAEGILGVFNGNATGPHKIDRAKADGTGWTVLSTGTGRVVARLRCE